MQSKTECGTSRGHGSIYQRHEASDVGSDGVRDILHGTCRHKKVKEGKARQGLHMSHATLSGTTCLAVDGPEEDGSEEDGQHAHHHPDLLNLSPAETPNATCTQGANH